MKPSLATVPHAYMQIEDLIRKTHNLASLPEAYYRARELLEDPNFDMRVLSQVLESDVGLTTRLLRLANSPIYGLPRRVDRVSYAVQILGRQTIRDMVTATMSMRVFSRIGTNLIDLSSFWHHSIYCGLIARQLGRRCHFLHDERMFVAGLLHDVGQLVLYQFLPVPSTLALSLAEPRDDGLYRAEQTAHGFTHAEVGAALLAHWRLPEGLEQSVRFHHEPEHADRHALEAAIVHIANSIANRMEPSRNIAQCESVISPFAWEITRLDESVIESALSEANVRFLDTLELLMPDRVPI